ncbi:hypothetical protein DRE_04030 [Drechslerella stenobrocha 248]|uniref:Uncharacterized protein n=1 Tax=Drechslerella stenobrocha 248 TaxID=1043628 RepID=W7ICF3_9PEZI|nr:hypothetical protein DRE_04030 [Drechslerella stenobrocha 248]
MATKKKGDQPPQGSSQAASGAKRKRVYEPTETKAQVAKRARKETGHKSAEPTGGPAGALLQPQVGMQTRSRSRREQAATQNTQPPNPAPTATVLPLINPQGRQLCPETQSRCTTTVVEPIPDFLLNKPRRKNLRLRNPRRFYGNVRSQKDAVLRGFRLKPSQAIPTVPPWRGISRVGLIPMPHRQVADIAVVEGGQPAGGSGERLEPAMPPVQIALRQSGPTGQQLGRETATAGGSSTCGESSGGVASLPKAVQHGTSNPRSLVPDGITSPRLEKRKRGVDSEGETKAPKRECRRILRRRQQQMATGQTDAAESITTPQAQEPREQREKISSRCPAPSRRKAPVGGKEQRLRRVQEVAPKPQPKRRGVTSDRPAPAVEPPRRSQRLREKSRGGL